MGSYKNEIDETYYHSTGSDVGQFSFNVPIVPSVRDPPVYTQRNFPPDQHAIPGGAPSTYLGQAFSTVSPLVVGSGGHDPDGGPHFGETCQGTYH
jgi:hypothetical protein